MPGRRSNGNRARRGGLLPAVVLLLPLMGAGCGSTAPEPVEAQFGHRFEATTPDGRPVLSPDPVADTTGFFLQPVYVDSLRVRIGETDAGRRVDVVVDALLSDTCTELNAVEQERHEHVIEVLVQARRPKGAMCGQMIRPFRTYVELDGPFEPGAYTLKVNDAVEPFEIE